VTTSASWRWADVSGDEHEIGYRELWDALSKGSLPPYVLVWRPGFREWLHAQNVAELADALGVDRAAPPSVVFPDPNATSPPAPPLGRYKNVVPPGTDTLLRSIAPSAAPAVPTFAKTTQKMDLRSPPAVPTPPPMANVPIPVRDVQPTLTDVEQPKRSTLRPAGAMPPPPRRMPPRPPPATPAKDEWDSPPARDVPHLPPPPAPVSPPAHAAPQPARRAQSHSVGGLTRSTVSTITAVGLVLPGLTLLAFALTHDPPGRKRQQLEAPASASAAPSVPPPLAGCVLEARAIRIAESAFVSVPVLVATTPDGARAAIGLASAKDRALGITLEPKELKSEQVYQQAISGTAILGVVPLVRSGQLEFTVDPPPVKLTFARSVDATKRFSIGVSSDGFSRAVGTTIDAIWPGKSDKPVITTPRVANAGTGGYVVTFRHGGQEGKVLTGRLNDDGTKQSELRAVETDSTLVGTPAVALNEQGGLLAFSGKKTAADPWHLELARFPQGGLPERGAAVSIPQGGPGGEAISPAVEGLDRGRFLLQWTEGSAGNRAVRVQVLSHDLVPIGDAITLSSPDQNAGQGALWAHDPYGLALFLVKKDSSHELWGASLRCR
jgi:hypothetical protein